MRNKTIGRSCRVACACLLGVAGAARAADIGVSAPTVATHAPAATVGASARDPDAGTRATTLDAAERMTRLQEQTMLLKAEIKKLDAQAEVARRSAALAQFGNSATLAGEDGATVRVVAIEGLGHRYSATLQMGEGEQFDVGPGDTLPNGLHIVSIGPSEVVGRWRSGRSLRLMPVLASASGSVTNAGVPSGIGATPTGGAAGLPAGYAAGYSAAH